ncbi:hypothetical protein VKT23_016314 [Stygiomarasmius scandens]|uniref:Uncharacterized protein n=1 Tax=Marasmiellus scandens TaxID=2682957 RepID=A0ABR1IV62_9AGAR
MSTRQLGAGSVTNARPSTTCCFLDSSHPPRPQPITSAPIRLRVLVDTLSSVASFLKFSKCGYRSHDKDFVIPAPSEFVISFAHETAVIGRHALYRAIGGVVRSGGRKRTGLSLIERRRKMEAE